MAFVRGPRDSPDLAKNDALDWWVGRWLSGESMFCKRHRPELEPSTYIKSQTGHAGACKTSSWAVERGGSWELTGFRLKIGSMKVYSKGIMWESDEARIMTSFSGLHMHHTQAFTHRHEYTSMHTQACT